MGGVAIGTHGGIRIALGSQGAVDAAGVQLGLIGMADGTVHRIHDRGTGPEFRGAGLGVALGTGHPVVDRGLEALVIYKERDLFATLLPGQGRIGVTGQAVLVGHALVVEHPPSLVGGMAIRTYRNLVGLLLPELATDHLTVHLLDHGMALGTGGGDVVAMDGRGRVKMREHLVRSVATGADRGHG